MVAQDSKIYAILNSEKQSYEVNIGYVDFVASFNWKKVILATNKTNFVFLLIKKHIETYKKLDTIPL